MLVTIKLFCTRVASYLNSSKSCRRWDLITGTGSAFSFLKGVSILVDFSANTMSINIIIRSGSGGLSILRSKQRVDITSIKNEQHSRRNLTCFISHLAKLQNHKTINYNYKYLTEIGHLLDTLFGLNLVYYKKRIKPELNCSYKFAGYIST